MINLQKTSGLPIELTEDFKLKFNAPMKEFPVSIVRTFENMQPVLMDPSIRPPLEVLYYVYRRLYLPRDIEKVKIADVSYDITILPPVMVGQEFSKVFGHYHANIPGTKIAHPEMYQVLAGKGMFLIQKMDEELKTLKAVYGIPASEGDIVIYPPNFGHSFMNLGNEVMVTANWCPLSYKALYDPIREKHGLAYYIVSDAKNGFTATPNNNYSNHPPFQILNMKDKIQSEFGFSSSGSMYTEAMNNPELLEFLNDPEKYEKQLSTLTS